MTPEHFTVWLQGHCELNPDGRPTQAQWEMIKDHLQHVFKKETQPLTDNPNINDWAIPADHHYYPIPIIC